MKYLLLDDRNIASTDNARLFPGPVRKDSRNPLFGEEKPWEVRFDNLYPNVIFDPDDGLFKCWYNPFIVDESVQRTPPEKRGEAQYDQLLPREMAVCYAVSRDGLVWEKPELGLVEFEGSAANNIVMRPTHGAGVRNDPADPDPERRYKMFTSMEEKHDQLAVSFSRDGLRWSPYIPCPNIGSHGDTHNTFFRDERAGTYVAFTRRWDPIGQRTVARTRSADFVHWTPASEVMRALPDQPHRQTYELQGFNYAGVYLGFVMILDTRSDFVDCELAWSVDSVEWRRLCPGEALIPRGPKGSYDHGCVYSSLEPIERDGELWLYYGGSDDTHMSWRKGCLCLARLRMDGFAGMTPADASRPGVVETTPLRLQSSRITVTADAKDGSVRVELLDDSDVPCAQSAPITADAADAPLTWKTGDIASRVGRNVRLRFTLTNAALYSFRM
ncbi:MAG: hypothetical protein JXA11_08825 [Phycisphaerae bacterium]|nr:hypothetical protein [Phycisphaerae bacterium]